MLLPEKPHSVASEISRVRAKPSIGRTFVMSSTTTVSNLSPYCLNVSFRGAPLDSERTVPRTEYPFSKSVLTTQMAMKPFAPVTSTFPDATAGI